MRKYIFPIVLFLLFTVSKVIGQELPGTAIPDTMKSTLVQQMTLQEMLIAQADKDGIKVTYKEVEKQLDNRIRYFTKLYGSKGKLEQASGKTICQLKEENWQLIKDRLIAEKEEKKILKHINVSDAEVKDFFNSIPKDSVPVYPECVMVGQLIIDITTSLDVAPNDYKTPLEKLGHIRQELIAREYTFGKAVKKWGTPSSGMLRDPMSGSTFITVSSLGPSLALLLDSMHTGDYSQPHIFNTADGQRSCRIVYLKAKIPAHKANLVDDYDKIQEVVLQQKKSQKMQDWLTR